MGKEYDPLSDRFAPPTKKKRKTGGSSGPTLSSVSLTAEEISCLKKIKRAENYEDHVGLCETHDAQKFRDLHFCNQQYPLTREQAAWHFLNVLVEKQQSPEQTLCCQ